MFIERDPALKNRARELRKNMTPWEKKLWHQFLRGAPVRFQRQKPIGDYIMDFYCAARKIAIEVDGGQHYEEENRQYDQCRTKALERYGVSVLRFSNLEIQENFSGVCETILQWVLPSAPRNENVREKEGDPT